MAHGVLWYIIDGEIGPLNGRVARDDFDGRMDWNAAAATQHVLAGYMSISTQCLYGCLEPRLLNSNNFPSSRQPSKCPPATHLHIHMNGHIDKSHHHVYYCPRHHALCASQLRLMLIILGC